MELKLYNLNEKRASFGRFEKGMRAWNKGKRGCHNGSSTSFRPGHQPHNTRHDGAISVRRDSHSGIYYKYIRLSLGKWVLLHRHIWQQHHGDIPRGMVITFRDGDQMNCSIHNLLMMSKADNLRRNYNAEKKVESLRTLYKRERIRKRYGLPALSKHGARIINL